jgi:trigger factor
LAAQSPKLACQVENRKEKLRTLKITTERLPNCQASLVIEPDAQQIEEALRRAAAKVANKYTIPGFRKGKAPYSAVVRAYGREALYDQVVEDLGDKLYKQALEESGLQPIAPGVLDNVTYDPLVLHLTLPMPPEVDLGDYRSVRVERPVVEVTDEEVDTQLKSMQSGHAEWVPVEAGAAVGDLLTMRLSGKTDEVEIIEEDAFELVLEEQSEDFPPGFDAEFVGKKAGDSIAFDLTYPDDWGSDRAGKVAHFEGEILSVKREEVPPLDDDFAPLVGDFDTLDALQASIRQNLTEERQAATQNDYANAVLQQIVDGATKLEYPSVLVEESLDRMIEDMDRDLRRSGIPLQDFLRMTGQTEQSYRQRMRANAEMRLKGDLVLDKLVELESLQATEEELAAHRDELVEDAGEDSENFRQMLESEAGKHAMAHDVERRKAVQRMLAIAEGTAPELNPAGEGEVVSENDPEAQPVAEPVADATSA